MSAIIEGTTIELTRGDTLQLTLSIENIDETEYIPDPGDVILFSMKKYYTSGDVLISKVIDNTSLTFVIQPSDTANLDFGDYVYDIQITTVDGVVDTIIPRSKFRILPEVG